MFDKDLADSHRLNVLLVGEEAAGIQTLRALLNSSHNVVAVMASPESSGSTTSLWNTAQRMDVNLWAASLVKQPSFAQQVTDHKIDLILNVHSLFIMHSHVSAARIGAFNMHPGPLPEYAGLNVPSWAIYFGETEHAVTIHQMVDRIDAGTIAYQQRFPIDPTDTGMSLMLKCVRAGLPLLKQLLNDAALDPGRIPRIPQSLDRRRYLLGAAPLDGHLCWHRPASQILNHVRAADYAPFASPWGHPTNMYRGATIGIAKTSRTGQVCKAAPGTIGHPSAGGVQVAAADEWVLVEKMEVNAQRVDAVALLSAGDHLEEPCCPSPALES